MRVLGLAVESIGMLFKRLAEGVLEELAVGLVARARLVMELVAGVRSVMVRLVRLHH